MKNYLYFSRSDKIGILFLSAIVIVLLFVNLTISRHHENNCINSIYEDSSINDSSYENNPVTVLYPLQNTIDQSNSYNKQYAASNTAFENHVLTKERKVIELNVADSVTLITLPGIGPVFASRIIKYRIKLGGYVSKNQLLEVYGFTAETFNKFKDLVYVDSSLIIKININTAAFKEILHHPYFNYETTLKIVRARDKTPFTSIEDFSSRTEITDKKVLCYLNVAI